MKSWISQPPLIIFYSNFKLKLIAKWWLLSIEDIKIKWRWPLIKDDLKWKMAPKYKKVEYLGNHWLDLTQIWNVSTGDQTKSKMVKMKTTFNRRRPQNIKSWISQQPLIGFSSNFKHKLRDQTKFKNTQNEDALQQKTTSNGRQPEHIKSWISQ